MERAGSGSLGRRYLLKLITAIAAAVGLSGCLDRIRSFEAAPHSIRDQGTLGYQEDTYTTVTTTRSVDAGGFSTSVELTHAITIFRQNGVSEADRRRGIRPNGKRLMEQNPFRAVLGTKRIGILATPKAEVAGITANPLASVSVDELLADRLGERLLAEVGLGGEGGPDWIQEPEFVTDIDGSTAVDVSEPPETIEAGSKRSGWQFQWTSEHQPDQQGPVIDVDLEEAMLENGSMTISLDTDVSNPHAGTVGSLALEIDLETVTPPGTGRVVIDDGDRFPHQAALTASVTDQSGAPPSMTLNLVAAEGERCPGQASRRAEAAQTIESADADNSASALEGTFNYSIAQPCGIKFPEERFNESGVTEVYAGIYAPTGGERPKMAVINIAKAQTDSDTVFAAIASDVTLPEEVSPTSNQLVSPTGFATEYEIVEYQDGNDIILRIRREKTDSGDDGE